MKWYQYPSAIDRLAAAYVLGTLQGPAKRRFEAMLPQKILLQLAVAEWTQRLSPLLTNLRPLEPSRALWLAIARRTTVKDSVKVEPLWRRIFSAIPASSLAVGILVGVMTPMLWNGQLTDDSGAQLPASYVGVLGTADGKPGLIVSSLRHGAWIDVKQMHPVAVPQGTQLHLWRLDAEGKAVALGSLPSGKWVRMPLPESAEKIFFQAVELAVSVERVGETPQAPSQPFVYRGLCGKLWK